MKMNKNLCLLYLLTFTVLQFNSFTALAQVKITGNVTGLNDQPINGASVIIKKTGKGTQTQSDGSFSIDLEKMNTTISISAVGFETKEINVSNTAPLVISLTQLLSNLNEIVVTGYTSQRKKDIVGAVSVIKTSELLATPAANLTTQLQGRAPGVVVSSSGEPGAAARVRIRGFASFGNNDPLYIIDGVPTEDPSKLNPQDIESIQVLKDATSASVYGSRAANGVIIVTTRQGKPGKPRLSYDTYAGIQSIPSSQYPEVLNTAEYVEYLKKSFSGSHPVFGSAGALSIPDKIVVSPGFKGGVSANDPRTNPDLYTISDYSKAYQIFETSPGTNWFSAVTRPGLIQSHQVTLSGGTDRSTYAIGLNYFDQEGTFEYTGYKRYSVRANSSFKPVEFIRIGENIQVSYEDRLNGDNKGENGGWSQAYRSVPYFPVYDIKGGWSGTAVGQSGNWYNPLSVLTRTKDDKNQNYKIFGNVYAEVSILKTLTARTSFGIDYSNNFGRFIAYRTYERSENIATTQLTEQSGNNLTYTWTNTLNFQETFGSHDIKILAGTEAIKYRVRGIGAYTQAFDFETPDFISLNTGSDLTARNLYNTDLSRSTLFSYFGRVDYTYNGKYLFNATLRRDGSSKFGITNRYATFPSFGVAWRVTEEPFIKSAKWLNDLKIRAGWGQLGSQKNVPALNQYSTFFSTASGSNYDLSGTGNSVTQGYRAGFVGNETTKWETTETLNIGFDATVFKSLDISFNVFRNDTKDLLVEQQRSGLEPLTPLPLINIGTMRNSGFDFGVNYRSVVRRGVRYDAGLTFSRYKNKALKLDNNGNSFFDDNLDRLAQVSRTQIGQPISSFFGYIIDGFFQNQAELDALAMNGAVIGSWRYKDLNGRDAAGNLTAKPDGKIDDNDKTFIGSPHPKFQMGLNLGVTWNNFDFSTFLFWNYGNKIFNYTKYYTDMRVFVGGVSKRVLYDSWTPTNTTAKLPRLGIGTENGFTSFTTSTSNTYYLEDGSYLRAKTIQLGYTFPKSLINRVKIQDARLYIQGQNLFTITKYSGPDPDLSIQSNQFIDRPLGVDRSGFPNSKQYLVGLNITL